MESKGISNIEKDDASRSVLDRHSFVGQIVNIAFLLSGKDMSRVS